MEANKGDFKTTNAWGLGWLKEKDQLSSRFSRTLDPLSSFVAQGGSGSVDNNLKCEHSNESC